MLNFRRSSAAVFDGVMDFLFGVKAGIRYDGQPSFMFVMLVFPEEIESNSGECKRQGSNCEEICLFHAGLLC